MPHFVNLESEVSQTDVASSLNGRMLSIASLDLLLGLPAIRDNFGTSVAQILNSFFPLRLRLSGMVDVEEDADLGVCEPGDVGMVRLCRVDLLPEQLIC